MAWSNNGQNKETVLLVTGKWPPFTSQHMEQSGFFTAVVTQVFERMNQPYEVRFMPWKRAVVMVEKGNAFATFPYRITEQRSQKYDFSNPVTTSTGRFFYLHSRFPDGIQWQTYNDLKRYTIGGTLGYWYETRFRQAGLDVEFVRSDLVSFRMLVFERLDMVAAAERVGWHVLQHKFPEVMGEISMAKKPLDQSTLHLMVSRDYPQSQQLLERFNHHLQQFKKSPAFDQLQNQYPTFPHSNSEPVQDEPE